ncbi:hypothetical protein LUZ61_002686 [Rhynchospora tenuis]|uniref:CTLH domain-containing protein n=1 Tax=Rhynchospora tenuis TaxID=198213 RepID=A0AAD6ES23_9POAL|nr:hypothetical protein LUZ61_002686 [Rhynchospora tenuis]
MKFFEEEVMNGNWDEVEKYLCEFTKVEGNGHSIKMFFEIRKQKYLEALDKLYQAKAAKILIKDLKVFASIDADLIKDITHLLTLDNFRENAQLSKCGDTESARAILLVQLKKLIEGNPQFHGKLQFPSPGSSRLRTLINQGLNRQHQRCKNPQTHPEVKTLFADHSCGKLGAELLLQADSQLLRSIPKRKGFCPPSDHEPSAPVHTPLAGGVSKPQAARGTVGFGNMSPVPNLPHSCPEAKYNPEEVTKTVATTLDLGSTPRSMDFHPIQQTLLLGVAYSSHIAQIYTYHGGNDIREHLEIDAHVGCVHDIAFANPEKQLRLITCGGDETIKVWDANTGTRQFILRGHDGPFLYSIGYDGKIKTWLYDNQGSSKDYDVPGWWNTTMAYSADGTRLFFCGTSKNGVRFLVEWNESEGSVKRTYRGLSKYSLGFVKFDTSRNRFLAVGDDYLIKFWDMNNDKLLDISDAEGGLPASPRIRFNKEGSLLAVSTEDNGIKILANGDGLRLLHTLKASFDALRNTSEAVAKNGDNRSIVDARRSIAESMDKSKMCEISEPAQCHSLRIMDDLRSSKICKLMYSNSGVSLLALGSNGIHLLWKWPCNEHNPHGKATASVSPQLWVPPTGIFMTNDVMDSNLERAVHCCALTKNDLYVVFASGGNISLFNMTTSETKRTFMHPPPAATFLAFNPQDNNVIAIGMEDSTIQIYNAKTREVATLYFLEISNFTLPNAFVVLNQIAIYEAPKLKCINQWETPITHATFSCDSLLICASFMDATVCIFNSSNLEVTCRILPAAYLPLDVSGIVHLVVVTAHPSVSNQFALGLTDGGVLVLEPLESEGKWGAAPVSENGSVRASSCDKAKK